MLTFILVIIYMYMCVNVCSHMHMCTHRGPKRASDCLELKLQVVMSCLTLELNPVPMKEWQVFTSTEATP